VIVPLTTLAAVALSTRLRERDAREVVSTTWHDDPATWAAGIAAQRGWHYAILDAQSRPVAMGGGILVWPGVAQTWLVAADELPRHAVDLVRAARLMHAELGAAGVHRFQTFCLRGYATGRRFLERIGYRHEGTSVAMGKNREDFDIMARLEAA
jgi:hypothetical protein